jgi:hypothetical protein
LSIGFEAHFNLEQQDEGGDKECLVNVQY